MKKFLSKRVVGAAVVVLLALFVIRPQVGILQKSVQKSLSLQLGHDVEMSSVQIRFLPRPGLEIENLAIQDGSDFGSEPLLRSPDVNAYLRFSSLLRGRLEISVLSFSDASLNLSRSLEGKWNIEELLDRTLKSSTAPTGSNRKEPRREFPYIEADHTRINFKNGLEKIHFALTNAQFSLWQESEDEWGMRLRASPIRTDANLTDSGVVTVSGSWQRSAVLAETPVQLSFQWKQAQLGQLSKLFSGTDEGWRGDVLFTGSLIGTLGQSRLVADTSIDQLRREDILINGDLHVSAHCAADFHSAQSTFDNLDCGVPAGDGSLELKGSTSGIPFSSYNLALVAKDASAQFALDFARRINSRVPQDSGAVGSINFAVMANRNGSSSPQFSGSGEALGVRLSSATTGTELQLGSVPLRLVSSKSRSMHSTSLALAQLDIGPFNVPSGKSAPVIAELSISREGYQGFIHGDANLKRVQQAADVFRIGLPPVSADGNVTMNLTLSHNWGDVIPVITGTAQLHSVRADVRGLNLPLQIRRADLAINTDAVKVTNLDASARDTNWSGSLSLPRPCASSDSCAFHFQLRSPQVSAAALNQLFNPSIAKHPWYQVLGLGASDSFFSKTSRNGSVAIDKLTLGNTVCAHFSADLELDKAKLSLAKIRGNFLDGKVNGNLTADFSVRPPSYAGTGTLDNVSLADVATLTHTEWAEGSGSATYEFKTAGWSVRDLLDSAALIGTFDIKDGIFPHVVLTERSDPLQATDFSGRVMLRHGAFSFDKAELRGADGVFNVSGTATLAGALNLRMMSESSGGYSLAGTLDQTRVSPITNPSTQAALKP